MISPSKSIKIIKISSFCSYKIHRNHQNPWFSRPFHCGYLWIPRHFHHFPRPTLCCGLARHRSTAWSPTSAKPFCALEGQRATCGWAKIHGFHMGKSMGKSDGLGFFFKESWEKSAEKLERWMKTAQLLTTTNHLESS